MTKLMAKMRPQKRAARSHGHDEQRQAHGELRKQIVERDGEGEMQPVNDLGGHQKPPGVGCEP
jgi:hypothetical protein